MENETTPSPEEIVPKAGEPTTENGGDVEADIEQLIREIARLTDERDQMQQQVLRTMADFQNFRKRKQEQEGQLRAFATEQFVRDLIPVLDNFERTVRAADGGATIEAITDGVRAVERQLRTALESQGVQRIKSLGEPFDPEVHEALGVEFTSEYDPDTVALEIEPGYKIADRVIRPARVKVASLP